jgi:hypothetical protein
MKLAAGPGIDPDRISFLKVLKHVRRSVIGATVTPATKMKDFMDTLASMVARKLDGGPRRPRVAGRLKRPDSKYSCRAASICRDAPTCWRCSQNFAGAGSAADVRRSRATLRSSPNSRTPELDKLYVVASGRSADPPHTPRAADADVLSGAPVLDGIALLRLAVGHTKPEDYRRMGLGRVPWIMGRGRVARC